MKNRILAILLSTTGIFPSLVSALGLGDIEVYSSLNQPLVAEITLTSVRPGETDGMLVKLASEEAFLRVVVDRPYYLTKLRFVIDTKSDGSQYVKVTTVNPVREPFITFLVDVDWPRGRLIREYTLFLDPPIFSGGSASTSTQSPTTEAPRTVPVAPVSAAGAPVLIQRDDNSATVKDEFEFDDDSPVAEVGEPVEDWDTENDFDLELEAEPSTANLPDIEVEAGKPAEEVDTEVVDSTDFFDEELDEDEYLDSPVLETDASTTDETEEAVGTDIDASNDDAFEETDAASDSFLDEAAEEFTDDEESWSFEEEPITDTVADDWDSNESFIDNEAQNLPDIEISYDSNLPYDEAATNALLAQFAAEDDAGGASLSGDGHLVEEGDMLYNIANRYKAPDVTVNQAMLAILRYNPDAFIRDNINSVKKGFVLRVPERDSMLQIDSSEALAEVQQQHALWREYRSQLAGAPSTVQDAQSADELLNTERETESSRESSGELSILSPGRDADASDRISGSDNGSESGSSVYIDLQLAREQLQAVELEKKELKERLEQLGQQIDKQERIISLQNEQLARLQQSLAGEPEDPSLKSDAETTFDEASLSDLDSDLGLTPDSEQEFERLANGTESTIADEGALADVEPEIAIDTEEDLLTDTLSEGSTDVKTDDLVDESGLPPLPGEEAESDITELVDTEEAVETEKADIEVAAPKKRIYTGLAGLAYKHIKKPYNLMLANALQSNIGLGVLAGIIILIIILLIAVFKPKKGEHKPSGIIAAATPDDVKTVKPVKPAKALFGERLSAMFAPITGLFGKGSKVKGDAAASESELFDDSESDPHADEEDDAIIEDLGEIDSFDDSSAEAAQQSELEKNQFAKTTITTSTPPEHESAAAAEVEEELTDDTTQEADVYLAYGLHDQAEELLTQAISTHPDRIEYKGKLLETYYAARKIAEFEELASQVKDGLAGRSSRIWDKTVAMGKEIAPENSLFSDAADSGLKVEDFAPAKPATADLDLGDAGASTTPDIEFGDEDEASTTTDFNLDLDEEEDVGDKTEMLDLSKLGNVDEQSTQEDSELDMEFDLHVDADEDGSELNIDFNADELGLETEVEVDFDTGLKDEAASESDLSDLDLNIGADDLGGIEDSDDHDGDATIDMPLDMDMGDNSSIAPEESDAIELDLGEDLIGIDDVDVSVDMTEFGAEDLTVSDDLIADLEYDEDESIESASIDTDFEMPEDDDTIIDADLDDDTIGSESSADEVSTKLDLAKAYLDMGDHDGASSTLEEVIAEGDEDQRREAEELLDQIN